MNERGKYKRDTKAWDKVVGIAYTVLLLAIPPSPATTSAVAAPA